MREHLVERTRPRWFRKQRQTVYQCPGLRSEWESNGTEGEGLILTRVSMWVPIV